MSIGQRCFPDMADISHYRERANHLRQLAERTWQDDLQTAKSLMPDRGKVAVIRNFNVQRASIAGSAPN